MLKLIIKSYRIKKRINWNKTEDIFKNQQVNDIILEQNNYAKN